MFCRYSIVPAVFSIRICEGLFMKTFLKKDMKPDDISADLKEPSPFKDPIDVQLAAAKEKFNRRYTQRSVLDIILSILMTLVLFLGSISVICALSVNIIKMPTSEMGNTIPKGAYMICNTLAYKTRSPERGQVVVAKNHVYRVIGIQGDTIRIEDGSVFLNGNEVSELFYLPDGTKTLCQEDFYEITVPEHQYFLLHDDRSNTNDSRTLGTVPISDIKGKIVATFSSSK